MADRKRIWVTVWMGRMAWLSGVLGLLVSGLASNLAAQGQPPLSSTNQEQIIVYVYTLATTVSISVDGLTIYRTDSYSHQGLWNHQFNLSSWLDTETQTFTVKARFANKNAAYFTLEVRSAPAGTPAKATILAKKTIRASEVEINGRNAVTVLSLDIARSKGNVRPLLADHSQVDLRSVTRKKSVDLVKEIFDALQGCNLDSLMALIDPALTNQALMEGAPPELVRQITLDRLKRDCVPGINVAETMDAYYKTANEDVMAPLNFKKMVYKFSRDESRKDKRGNLYTPKHTIKFKTRGRRGFVARPYLSYTDDKRNRRFVSRFVFEATY